MFFVWAGESPPEKLLQTLFTSKFVGALLHATVFSQWLMMKQMSAEFIRRKITPSEDGAQKFVSYYGLKHIAWFWNTKRKRGGVKNLFKFVASHEAKWR
ncbi:MAG: hypothetical protein NZ781_11065 [Armatimonadetes bacterium]|nr:hypothetical protein [Armatimonadota bacterium]